MLLYEYKNFYSKAQKPLGVRLPQGGGGHRTPSMLPGVFVFWSGHV